MTTEAIRPRSAELDHIWFTRCPVPTASGIAHAHGWLGDAFREDGISVGVLQDASPELLKHHFDHELPGLFREGGNIPALAAKAAGADTRLIGLTWIDERQVILVRPERGPIEPADLKGLRVALPGWESTRAESFVRGMSLQGIRGALGIAGLTIDDITLVDVSEPVAPTGRGSDLGRIWTGIDWLVDGRVDAVYVKGASAVDTAVRAGVVIGIDLDVFPDRTVRINNGTPRPITVHRQLLEDHFDVVIRFLSETLRAADWAADNLDGVREILQRETRAGVAGVNAAYRNGFHRALHPDLSAERVDFLKLQATFLWAHGFLDHSVDIDAWVDRRPLDAALALRAGRAAA